MPRTINDVIATLPADQQQAIETGAAQLIAEALSLAELRKARDVTQRAMGATLRVNQAAISKLEHRTDMYISTLREYIEAMGGTLDIIVRFPNHPPIRINQFEDRQES